MSFIERILKMLRGKPKKYGYSPPVSNAPPPKVTYELGENGGGVMFIRCLVCNMQSFNTEDIQHKWCATCNQYHPVNQRLANR